MSDFDLSSCLSETTSSSKKNTVSSSSNNKSVSYKKKKHNKKYNEIYSNIKDCECFDDNKQRIIIINNNE